MVGLGFDQGWGVMGGVGWPAGPLPSWAGWPDGLLGRGPVRGRGLFFFSFVCLVLFYFFLFLFFCFC